MSLLPKLSLSQRGQLCCVAGGSKTREKGSRKWGFAAMGMHEYVRRVNNPSRKQMVASKTRELQLSA
jgi:hypothetical protein